MNGAEGKPKPSDNYYLFGSKIHKMIWGILIKVLWLNS
jgi:hypothetical protein